MAHPDLAKVFGQPAGAEPQALYEQIADAFQAAGVCAEVSSAGYRQTLGELYPDPELLAMLQRAGRAGHAGLGRARAGARWAATSRGRWPSCTTPATGR